MLMDLNELDQCQPTEGPQRTLAPKGLDMSGHPFGASLCSFNFILVIFVLALCLFKEPFSWVKPHSIQVLARCTGTIERVFIAKSVCAPKPHYFHLLTLERALVWAGSLSFPVVWRRVNFPTPLTHLCKYLGPTPSSQSKLWSLSGDAPGAPQL